MRPPPPLPFPGHRSTPCEARAPARARAATSPRASPRDPFPAACASDPPPSPSPSPSPSPLPPYEALGVEERKAVGEGLGRLIASMRPRDAQGPATHLVEAAVAALEAACPLAIQVSASHRQPHAHTHTHTHAHARTRTHTHAHVHMLTHRLFLPFPRPLVPLSLSSFILLVWAIRGRDWSVGCVGERAQIPRVQI